MMRRDSLDDDKADMQERGKLQDFITHSAYAIIGIGYLGERKESKYGNHETH